MRRGEDGEEGWMVGGVVIRVCVLVIGVSSVGGW